MLWSVVSVRMLAHFIKCGYVFILWIQILCRNKISTASFWLCYKHTNKSREYSHSFLAFCAVTFPQKWPDFDIFVKLFFHCFKSIFIYTKSWNRQMLKKYSFWKKKQHRNMLLNFLRLLVYPAFHGCKMITARSQKIVSFTF